jgi:hypothetical protein
MTKSIKGVVGNKEVKKDVMMLMKWMLFSV